MRPQYDGGLQCCGGTDIVDGKHTDTRFLLDADPPIPPLEDEVFFRWRFYYEDYTPSLQDTYHVEWQFGHIECHHLRVISTPTTGRLRIACVAVRCRPPA